MFDQVHHFRGIFPKLEEMGAPATGNGQLIELLAGVTEPDLSQLDLSSFDVVDRSKLRNTALFRSYCEHTFRLWMEAAARQLAATGGCESELKTALEIRPVSQGLTDTAMHALKIFHPGVPVDERARLEYVIENKGVTTFLKSFAPLQPITLASRMLQEDPPIFSGWSLDALLLGARYLGI